MIYINDIINDAEQVILNLNKYQHSTIKIWTKEFIDFEGCDRDFTYKIDIAGAALFKLISWGVDNKITRLELREA